MDTARREVLVHARDVSVRHGARQILDRVDMSVERGEIVTLIGLNGAGKTTLVRVLLGLETPHGGSITRAPGLRVGYSPQHLHRDATLPLTVGRFLRLGAATSRNGVNAVLEEVGAPGTAASPLSAISGGELHRVLLARALLREPDLLVLDEPVAGVDVSGQGDLYRLIAEVRKRRGCGVVLVSHDLHVVMAATDRVVCLNHHVCCTGHPHAVANHPEFVSLFGRRVADVLAVYEHHHDHTHGVDGAPVPLDQPALRDGA